MEQRRGVDYPGELQSVPHLGSYDDTEAFEDLEFLVYRSLGEGATSLRDGLRKAIRRNVRGSG